MSPSINSVVIPAADLDKIKAVYTALLGAPHTDESYYVGYNVGGFEIGLNPNSKDTGPVAYIDVDDLDAARQSLLDSGATETTAPMGAGPNSRVCVLADPAGNPIGLRGK